MLIKKLYTFVALMCKCCIIAHMNKQIKKALDPIWNCRAMLPIESKVKVRAVQMQQELNGNPMTQDQTLAFIINEYKNGNNGKK